jgi:hypothetical protein
MTRLPARLLFLLALLSLLSLPARAQNLLGACDNGQAGHFEIGLVIASPSDDIFVTVTNEATGTIEDSRWAHGDQIISGTGGCHWAALIEESEEGYATVSDNVPLRLKFEVSGGPDYEYTYWYCNTDGDLDSFYCPDAGVIAGNPDLLFYFDEVDAGGMRVYPVSLDNINVSHTTGDIADYFTDENWVLPLQIEKVCAAEGYSQCPAALWDNTPFLTPQAEGRPICSRREWMW